jgi:hypothetical protein
MMAEHSSTNFWYSDGDDDDESITEVIEVPGIEGSDEDDVNATMDIASLGHTMHTGSSDARSHRCLHPGSCVLSRYMTEHRTGNTVCTGFLGNQCYITPLHHMSIVPGHSTPRVSVCDTGSTKLGMLVHVRCHVRTSVCPSSISGSLALSNLINTIHESVIESNDTLPHCFCVSVVEHSDTALVPDLSATSSSSTVRIHVINISKLQF